MKKHFHPDDKFFPPDKQKFHPDKNKILVPNHNLFHFTLLKLFSYSQPNAQQ